MSLSQHRSCDQSETVIIEEKIVKANGATSYRKYSRGRFLGKGGFAKVYEVLNLDTEKVSAAKLVAKASLTKARTRQKLMSEIKIHRSLHHPNIVGFEHFFEDSENVYILLELCTNQTLTEMMRRRKRITEIEAQCYTHQVICGLKYLHEHRIIHRDIKLGNLFLSDKLELKIGDLGLACKLEFDGERRRTICGTPNYIAPEILDGKHGHSYEADVWSLGVLLYTFVVGKPPFETSDVKTTYRRIKMNAYSFPEHVQLSDNVKNLITSILQNDPQLRPTLDQVLQHPFFATSFPKLLPVSTLAVPPSANFLRQFQGGRVKEHATTQPPKKTEPRIQRAQTDGSPMSPMKIGNKGNRTTSVSSYTPQSKDGPKIWVKKWIDYSSKYGLGYLLSNNSVGVFFNDSTKIVSSPDNSAFLYVQRVGPNKEEDSKIYSMETAPLELNKKVTLLEHFQKHLVPHPSSRRDEYVFIKKWLTTSHAVIFRLNNKIVQVCFQDKTEIILCSNTKKVTYVNKLGESSVYSLKNAGESGNAEMSKRLKYTKEVLTNMLGPSDRGQVSP